MLPLSKHCTAMLDNYAGIVRTLYPEEGLTKYRLPCSAEARRSLCLTQGSQASLGSFVKCPCSKSMALSSKQMPLPPQFWIEAASTSCAVMTALDIMQAVAPLLRCPGRHRGAECCVSGESEG